MAEPLRVVGSPRAGIAEEKSSQSDADETAAWTTAKSDALARENADVESRFAAAESQRTDWSSIRRAERELALQDRLEKVRKQLQAQLDEKQDSERSGQATRIAAIRREGLRTSALETAAAAAKRRAATEGRLQQERETTEARLKANSDEMQSNLRAAEIALRAEGERDPLPASPAGVTGREAQLSQLRRDAARQSPARLEASPASPPADRVSPVERTAREHATVAGRSAQRATTNSGLIDHWSKEEARAVIQQWAKVHYYELAGYRKTSDAADRTEECLRWLRANLWKPKS